MTSRKRLPCAVLVAACLFTACSGGNMHERRDAVNETIQLTHETLGGELGEWGYERTSAPGCQAQLGIENLDDAWYERQAASILETGLSAQETAERLTASFLGAGFEVDLMTATRSGARGIRAIRDDIALIGNFGADGMNFSVTAGPCAVHLTGIGERYDEIEHFDPE